LLQSLIHNTVFALYLGGPLLVYVGFWA